MRYHILRFDIWLCLLLSVLLAMGTGKIANSILPQKYEEHKQEHIVEVGQIGGKANDETFRAKNVEDLLSHETFTIESKGIQYMNRGAGYYKGMYLYAVTLPSGEKVAARINNDSVLRGDDIYTGMSTLPVGRVIKEDLSTQANFLSQIEHSEPLDRKDFYIDMVGGAEIKSEEDFIELPVMLVQLATVAITFPIFHMIGSKIGIFPCIIPPKKKKEEEWQ